MQFLILNGNRNASKAMALAMISATMLSAVGTMAPAATPNTKTSGTSNATAGAGSSKAAGMTATAGSLNDGSVADAKTGSATVTTTSSAISDVADATKQAAGSGTTDGATSGEAVPTKVLLKPGQPISINMETEDIQPTDDPELARQQAEKYSDSPEAAFILAVALTRTSRVEEALKQVRHARYLAQAKGGPEYFNKMISSYEKMLEYCPDDNRVRYGLAWAYYMKAYLLSQSAKKAAAAAAQPTANVPAEKTGKTKKVNAEVASEVLAMINPKLAQNVPTDGKVSNQSLPHIPGALENAPPAVVPQVKQYFEAALKNLDDLLARKPDDVWARVYRAHLAAEYSGDLTSSMAVWRDCQQKYPQNPASYFFLGEGYLKQGNLKECLSNITRAIALRALGN